ncbi:hypothetical protein E3N88_26894 [Mikania micrantha]|uniref:Uncharacterized protein n=1 Tax=Mikania micrantha TaxID=192012 RepID=A0A5N6MV47_9ASTR|nr:hypothetical protein E3N88_26894 [Mikania micrantha]
MPQHFVNIRLEGDYPIPTLSAVWKRYRNDAAGAWELIYQERIQRYRSIIEANKEHVLPPPGEGADLRGVYVTRIARFNGLIDMEPAGMEAFRPVRLDRRTVLGMRIAQTFPRRRWERNVVDGGSRRRKTCSGLQEKLQLLTLLWEGDGLMVMY